MNKLKVVCITSVILVAILGMSTLTLYGSTVFLRQDINSQRKYFEQQIVGLNNQHAIDLDYYVKLFSDLEKANLKIIDGYYTDNHPLFGSPYILAYGMVVNFGGKTASNVKVTAKIYDSSVLLKTENILLKDIHSQWYGKFDVKIQYSGDATTVSFEVSFT